MDPAELIVDTIHYHLVLTQRNFMVPVYLKTFPGFYHKLGLV